MRVVWTDYLRYRAKTRQYDLNILEHILAHSSERYIDTESGRMIVIGRHEKQLVMIPYDADDDSLTPITVHSTTREQISFRLSTGRLTYE